MKILKSLGLLVTLLMVSGIFPLNLAFAQNPEALCGWDENGNPLQCVRPDSSANLESACLTTGRIENCVPYHQNSCEIRGFQSACRLYQMGRNCFGGDPNICNYYRSLLQANTDCTLDRNQNACMWLQQQPL